MVNRSGFDVGGKIVIAAVPGERVPVPRRMPARRSYSPDPRVAARECEVQRLREELASVRAELASESERCALLNTWRFASVRSDGELVESLEALARQIIESGGYSTPQLRHAVALLAEQGVDVRAAREVKP